MITAKTLYILADMADYGSPVTVDGKEIDEIALVYVDADTVVRIDIHTKEKTEQPAS